MEPIKNSFRLKGKYRITTFRSMPEWIPRNWWMWAYKRKLLMGLVLRRTAFIDNLIVLNTNHGLNLFFQHLGGNAVFPLELTLAGIGTGTTAPTDSDTDLETPIVSVDRSTVDIGLDTITTEWFFTNGQLPNDTYNEFGLFCDTQLFCRSIISPAHTKASNEDTLVEYIISGTN